MERAERKLALYFILQYWLHFQMVYTQARLIRTVKGLCGQVQPLTAGMVTDNRSHLPDKQHQSI